MVTIAIYNGEEFDANELSDGKISLITQDQTYLSKGFTAHPILGRNGIENYYIKKVTKQEVTEFYSEYESYIWRGFELNFLGESDTQYWLSGLPGDSYKTALRLGMTPHDKYEYSIWVNKSNVTVKKFKKNELTGEETLLNP